MAYLLQSEAYPDIPGQPCGRVVRSCPGFELNVSHYPWPR